MFMMVLIVLLVMFIGLLVLTVLRDKNHKMAARGGSGFLPWQQGRRRSSNQNSGPASRPHEKKSETNKFTADQTEWVGQPRRVQPTINTAKLQKEDADVVLGLKANPVRDPAIKSRDDGMIKSRVDGVNKSRMPTQNDTRMLNQVASSATKPLAPPRFIIYLKAVKDAPYCGYELLQALLASHFRFGDMNIFHRHERTTGEGKTLFSLAAATKTGTFDLTKIGSFTCSGLSLFLAIKDQPNPVLAFDLMLGTAQQLVEELGGHILDELQEPLTIQKIQLWREEIRNFVRQHGLSDLTVSATVD